MKIGICNDHAGVDYKKRLMEYLTGKGYEVVNFGTDTTDSMDYPDVAHPLANAVEKGEVDLGIASWIPFSTASATCHEDRQPLNESEATTTLHMIDKISTNIILILIP